MQIAPTPKSTVYREGSTSLVRFHGPEPAAHRSLPLLLVPSIINRWYILDLREGSSLVEALVRAGVDTYCIDWGQFQDEDRFLTWDDIVSRVERAIRTTARCANAARVGLLGYCMGGTLAAIACAMQQERVAGLVNLAGPIDFAHGGLLARMTDERWFDPEAIASAGNVSPAQMQSAFVLLRPTAHIAKWVALLERASNPAFRDAFAALETWANDNVAFPADAYVTYIRELYQHNMLVKGEHRVRGHSVDLRNVVCPVLTVVATRDAICPPPAALALQDCSGARSKSVISVPGGHVGAVVGTQARSTLYPQLIDWLAAVLDT